VSAFSPITSPSVVPWGEKAMSTYLGDNKDDWKSYDALSLVENSPSSASMLIDTGTSDQFLEEQLKPELFIAACEAKKQALNYRMQPGYDHSYYFIASFIADHIEHHANTLNK